MKNHSAQPDTAASMVTHTCPDDVDHNAALQSHLAHLQVAVEHELRLAPQGLSEHALIKKLQQAPWQLLGDVRFDQPELLYPVHFLLFHTLYKLRDELTQSDETLSISPLLLRLHTDAPAKTQCLPDRPDELRTFYLDLNQYRMSAQHIHAMLNNFYTGFRAQANAATDADLKEAARCLDYEQLPTDFTEVKKRFRRAVMRAHPDRGGSTGQIQRLNSAFGLLREHFCQR